jgi:ribonuclease P protein component
VRPFVSLRRKAEFGALTRRGRRRGGRHLTVFTLPARGLRPRAGVTVGTAVGNAVVRNRVRRRVKSILERLLAAGPVDVVVIVRPGAGEATFAALRAELDAALLG